MEGLGKAIFVTEPFLPPLEELWEYLKQIWDSKWVTNNAAFHQEFEKALCKYLGVEYISLFTNGTLALIAALKELNIGGEVITTPFSFVATTHALWWNDIKPVFVDIEPTTFNINPNKIEAAITAKTTGILPVHIYGNPCKVNKVGEIAEANGLKVIYDAAHAFGVRINGKSILNYGDLSILSFHATKVFTTFEGGAIACSSEKTKKDIDYLKNFGFADEVTVVGPGMNAKMSEFQAAIGLLQLKYIDESIKKRRKISELYRSELKDIEGLTYLEDMPSVRHCYSYFPILIDESKFGKSRDALYEDLKEYNIYTRRYFYPLISEFPMYANLPSSCPKNLPVAERISKQVLCLPIYPNLSCDIVKEICRIIEKISMK